MPKELHGAWLVSGRLMLDTTAQFWGSNFVIGRRPVFLARYRRRVLIRISGFDDIHARRILLLYSHDMLVADSTPAANERHSRGIKRKMTKEGRDQKAVREMDGLHHTFSYWPGHPI